MGKEKVIMTIITGTYFSNEYSEGARCCVIELTQSLLDRIRLLAKVVQESETVYISDRQCADWYDKRPLFTFKELGDKFILSRHYDGEDYEAKFGTVEAKDAVQDYERMDTEFLQVTKTCFYFVGYGKNTSDKTESISIGLEFLDKELANTEPTDKKLFYLGEDFDKPVELEDLPKYLNDENEPLKMYATEMLKQGE